MVAISDDCFFATTARVPCPKPNLYSNNTTSSTASYFSTDTIIVSLDSSSNPAVRSLLAKHSANLIDVGTHMLSALRELAPSQLAARVGDIHENLSYEMQECEDIASMLLRGKLNKMMKQNGSCCLHDDSTSTVLSQSILDDIQSFEHSIRSELQQTHISYRGSYMRTLHTAPQPAHVDYDYPTLAEHGTRLFLAFFPLTEEGAYLQLWHEDPALFRCVSDDEDADDDNDIGAAEEDDYPVHDSSSISSSISSTRRIKSRSDVSTTIVEGTIVCIPYGKMLIVPSDTIHGGGFKRGINGNLRFHLYIAVGDDDHKDNDIDGSANGDNGEKKRIGLLQHPMNKYTERYDRTRELCERFVDANGLDRLLGHFFDD